MRTVYAKVLLWCFGALLASLVAIVAISIFLSSRQSRPVSPFERIDAFRLDEAIRAYESGGAAELRKTMDRLSHYFPAEQYLTNAKGIDLVTGEDRSAILAQGRLGPPKKVGDHFQLMMADPKGQYRLIVIVRGTPFKFTSILPYYLPILIALAGLCWLLAANIASPLRLLARTVDRFGAGDFDARAETGRRDELGDLARTFNQMAERLQRLLIAERRLLQDISHELRSPLARLSFAVELTKTAADREAAAARLRKEVVRLTDLVGSLIQVTRSEGEFWERDLEAVSLDGIVNEVLENCQLEAAARNCHIDGTAVQPATLRGDSELLRRAIENVVRNAIRFAPESSAIEVGLTGDPTTATITIRDYGPGVPEDMLTRIFAPFFRVDDSRTGATGGTGLGLSIAQRAVMLHHGQISARNVDPGLLVTISLPRTVAG